MVHIFVVYQNGRSINEDASDFFHALAYLELLPDTDDFVSVSLRFYDEYAPL